MACRALGLEHFALVGSLLWAFRFNGLLALGILPYWALGLVFLRVISFLKFKLNFYNLVNEVTKLVFNDFRVTIFQPSIC